LDGQCGTGGICEPSQYCSFPGDCPSGRRYGQYAGDLSNQCVEYVDGGPGNPDGPLGPDAGSDGGVTVTGCGKPLVLTDDFAGATRKVDWGQSFTVDGAAMANQTGGQLVITLATNGNHYAGYDTTNEYDLTESRVYVHAVGVPNAATHGQMLMEVYSDGNNALRLGYDGGQMFAQRQHGGVTDPDLVDVPYNATNHAWWQIHQTGGSVIFETSLDGSNWNNLITIPTPFDVSHMHIEIFAGTYQPETNPGTAIFDDFNGGVPTGMTWCAASTPTDDFNDTTRAALWGNSGQDTGCTIAESGGTLNITPPASATQDLDCWYQTGNAYDLSNSAVSVKVTAMVNAANCDEVVLKAIDPFTHNSVQVKQDNGSIYCEKSIGATDTQIGLDTPFSLTSHKYWRLHGVGGAIYCEASPDNMNWTQVAMNSFANPSPIPLTGVQLKIGANVCNPGPATPGTVSFDSFNLP
jgi:hypothetical protein